jgi:Xaa-Pro dipeptidase
MPAAEEDNPMSHGLNPNATANAGALIAELGLDALVASSPENFGYITGAHVPTARNIPTRHGFAVTTAAGKQFLVVVNLEKNLLSSETAIGDIRTYVEFTDQPVERFAEEMQAEGLGQGRIGLDLQYLPAAAFMLLKAALPQADFVDTTARLGAFRAHKSLAEIDILEKAAKGTHRAVLDAMETARVGETEKVMSDRIAANMIANGADGTAFMCFGSGKYTHLFHAPAFDWAHVSEGDVIRFDVGGQYGAWSSDFARTYSAGSPTALQRQTYSALIDIETATIGMVEPGIPAEDVFYFCRDQFKKQGLQFYMPHVGHSFGLELHEAPMLRAGEKTVLKPGMVFNIEPSTFDENRVAYHTEDLLVVTETGSRLLTLGLAPREMPVIGQKIIY